MKNLRLDRIYGNAEGYYVLNLILISCSVIKEKNATGYDN